ncbi:hypothetical protein [Vibrio penaeicida]|uniref:hypothetical protein n=1 Tax=Vibrio penaeicida TaxID=104609 RepID=UPI001CC482CB|nr:hypothetical protein [Vibrio penaeicida]
MTTIFKSILLLGFVLIQGCANKSNEPVTLAQKYERFEEEDYTDWEQDEIYFEKMQSQQLGSIASHLILSFDETGEPFSDVYIEDTLGFKTHEKVYLASTFFTSFTNLGLASLLVMNNDSPSWGSPEYRAQLNYRRDTQNMSANSHFFSSIYSMEELEPYQGIEPKSAHHEIHLKTKTAFLNGLNGTIEALSQQGIECLPADYDPIEDGDNYSASRVFVRPLSQYEAGYHCSIDGDEYLLGMTSLVIKNAEGDYRVVSLLNLGKLADIYQIDSMAIMEATDWQGTMSTCRTCDEKYDRVVRISSKNQAKDWYKEFAKGSIYR